MEKSPTLSYDEFALLYPTHESARAYLMKKRWHGKTPSCEHCNAPSKRVYMENKAKCIYRCQSCKRRFNVTTNSIFQGTRMGLHIWLRAMYLLMSARKGIASTAVKRQLGISQRSAWFLLHRIRYACPNTRSDYCSIDPMMSGIVEVDEMFYGGEPANRHKSCVKVKLRHAVAGLAEREKGGGIKSIRAAHLASRNMSEIEKFFHDNVEVPARISVDGAKNLGGISGTECDVSNHSEGQYARKDPHGVLISTNGIEGIWSLIKRGLSGTYNYVIIRHLNAYLDEYTFRYNVCKLFDCGADGFTIAETVAEICNRAFGRRLRYNDLVKVA